MNETQSKTGPAKELLASMSKQLSHEEQIPTETCETKIFLGFELNADLQVPLEHCKQWKIDRTVAEGDPTALKEIQHCGKRYIGQFLNSPQPTHREIEMALSHVKEGLVKYLPELENAPPPVHIFGQLFIS
jgi:hypothetical protein